MGKSLREYITALGRWGWLVLVDIFSGLVGAYLDVSGTWGFPTWLWVILLAIAFVVVPFLAFHKVRIQRDEFHNRLQSILNAKPAIKTTIPSYPNNYSLEIENIGGDGEFKVEIEVIEGAQNLMEKILKFYANWEDTDQIQRQLVNQEAKRIKIARLVDDGTHIQLCSRNLQNNQEYYIKAYSDISGLDQTQTLSEKPSYADASGLLKLKIDPDPKFKLLVTIFAVGGLRSGKPFKGMYSLSLKGLEISTQ